MSKQCSCCQRQYTVLCEQIYSPINPRCDGPHRTPTKPHYTGFYLHLWGLWCSSLPASKDEQITASQVVLNSDCRHLGTFTGGLNGRAQDIHQMCVPASNHNFKMYSAVLVAYISSLAYSTIGFMHALC